MQAVEIRELIPETNEEDLERLLKAYLTIWNAPENLKFLSFTLRPVDEEVVRSWLDSHRVDGVRYFCAFDAGGEIAGISIVRSDPIEGLESLGVGVRPASKQRGIGKELIDHLIDLGRSEGYHAIQAPVFADNVPMLYLLLSFGFIPARMEYNRRADGADLVYLKRSLRS